MIPLYVIIILLTIPSTAPQAQLSCSVGKKSERAEYVDRSRIRNKQIYDITRDLCRNEGNCVQWARTQAACIDLCKKNKNCCHWFHNGYMVGSNNYFATELTCNLIQVLYVEIDQLYKETWN